MEKEEKEAKVASRPRQYHLSHSIRYGEDIVQCVSCGATREQLFEECPKPIDFEMLVDFLREMEASGESE